MRQAKQERCDHCKKFINEHHNVYTLLGVVSKGVEWQFAICTPCFNKRSPDERKYWDDWVAKQNLPAPTP